ncbi:MAG: UMP kinase [Clostridiales bacterium]|nr:UMP kinase [Clostridiales bacterium]
MNYKRVLLKLSGEMLGENGKLFDHEMIDRVAATLCKVVSSGVQLGVVIGAGNIWRGRQGKDMNAVTADQMGMLGTVINCLAMQDAIRRAGGKAQVMSAIEMNRVCDLYRASKAVENMENGTIMLFAGGSGNPFFSTDTAVVLRAVEVEADAILLAKNIDGVYDSDPKKNPDAKLIRALSYEKAQEMRLRVMDTAAFALCADNKVPVVRVFMLDEPDNILKVLSGDDMGTTLTSEK